MALYLGNKKVAVTNTVEKQAPSMKAYFEARGKCGQSPATSFNGIIQYSDTENVKDMSLMFNGCSNLKSIPLIDTSKVTNMLGMFSGCYYITTIPLLDTSKVTNMNSMFYDCNEITTIPLLNTSNVSKMDMTFSNCLQLTTIPQLDTSKVTSMNKMFDGCYELTTIPQLDTSNVTNMNNMFNYCSKLETIHMININANLDIHFSTKFTREALLEIIGNLKAQTGGNKTLTMGSTNLAKLTDEDKSIATNKGWTLA